MVCHSWRQIEVIYSFMYHVLNKTYANKSQVIQNKSSWHKNRMQPVD